MQEQEEKEGESIMTCYCQKCGTTKDEKEFYLSNNVEKYPPNGRLNICKNCMTMHVDNWDPETYKWILQEIDVPYMKWEWDALLAKFAKDPKKVNGLTILGRYLSKMKLNQYKRLRWSDTEELERQHRETTENTMRAQGYTDEQIQEEIAIDRTPPRPKLSDDVTAPVGEPVYEEEKDEFADKLTDEEKTEMRLKWGKNYTCEEWVRMEQLYQDFMRSYDIQTAGHKDTLKKICKASLKADELIDIGDRISMSP